MKILALETSSDACSAALSVNGEVRQLKEIVPRRHGERIIPMIDQLLNDAALSLADLDAIAFGCGPGSFIGLRIASGVTQGLAFGADLPVIPVSSLAAIAQQCVGASLAQLTKPAEETRVLVAVDARMDEVYWASYRYGSDDAVVQLIGTENVTKPDKLPAIDQAISQDIVIGAGSGWQVYAEQLKASTGVTSIVQDILPDAASVADIALEQLKLGKTVDASQAQPVYVRDKVANKPQ